MCNQLVCTESGRRGAGLPRRPQDLALTCQDRARPCGPLGASPRPRAELDGRGREDPSPNLSKATGATLGLLPSSALSFVRSAFSLYLIASFRHRRLGRRVDPNRGAQFRRLRRPSHEALWAASPSYFAAQKYLTKAFVIS